MEIEGYTDTPHVKVAKARPHVKGCPGNDGGEHVYIWICTSILTRWDGTKVAHEKRVCAGCLHSRSTKGNYRSVNLEG